tara:strand:+ start:112 stop:246 length:135 start_codon:yes stop_codon:yes gene_type:complete
LTPFGGLQLFAEKWELQTKFYVEKKLTWQFCISLPGFFMSWENG